MKLKHKNYLKILGLLGALAVILGAFGAHFLKEKLSSTSLSAYQTGIQYHFYHTLAGLGALILGQTFDNKLLKNAMLFFIIGIFLFSGSLYLLALKDFLELPALSVLGPITPIGGLAFILGWIFLAAFARSVTSE